MNIPVKVVILKVEILVLQFQSTPPAEHETLPILHQLLLGHPVQPIVPQELTLHLLLSLLLTILSLGLVRDLEEDQMTIVPQLDQIFHPHLFLFGQIHPP